MPVRSRPETVCPPDHRHAGNATCRSLHGCICDPCREAATRYENHRAQLKRDGINLLVDATGTHRRIRAMQRVGWSRSMIARHAGYTESWVSAILRNRRVQPETATRIRSIYDRLAWNPPQPTTPSGRAAVANTRRHAQQAGFLSPIDWEDIDNDPEPQAIAA